MKVLTVRCDECKKRPEEDIPSGWITLYQNSDKAFEASAFVADDLEGSSVVHLCGGKCALVVIQRALSNGFVIKCGPDVAGSSPRPNPDMER